MADRRLHRRPLPAGRPLRIVTRQGEGGAGPGGGSAKESPAPTTSPSPPQQPISTVPTDPIAHPVAEPFFHAGGGAEYWDFVPRSYDATDQTPTKLLVWAHGCGGHAEGDAWVVDPGAQEGVAQDWMTLSLGGREGECWAPSVDEAKVMAALADFETHFNVDRRRVFLGGYSAGGDLTYRTGFRHSSTFAGLLIENSSPFRDTESTQAESLAAATTRLHIAHLAHTEDDIYPIAEIQAEVGAVKAAGFPIELIVRPGGHSDSHTDPDLLKYLLPYIDAGWTSP
jgi:catechol 2,3-dioxygenase-like lactoylglutathione lyase family enzyme